jgi:uncharacterized protein (DUF2461 family)
MSMSYDIVRSVLDKAVKYYMPPSDIAELINNIFENLEYDKEPYTTEDVINVAKSIVNDNLFNGDKEPYNKWLELHG